MTRLEELFNRKKSAVLNVFCTAGYPRLESTMEVLEALQDNGVDLVEIGIPYSDPLADGPVIQETNSIALANGMSIPVLFEKLKGFREKIHIPVVLMGYFNPVLQYGFEKFCRDASNAGIDGLIIPDLPDELFSNEYASILKKFDLDFIFLITPETSEYRVRMLDQLSSGFLYAVAASSITGSDHNWSAVIQYLQRLESYQLKNPVLLGFGIKDKQSFDIASSYATGGIIGTAYIKALGNGKNIASSTSDFIHSIRGGQEVGAE